MDLRVLRYFVTVAREQCLTSAAARLRITQPTLSRQLKELEDEFGAQLFNRGSRSQRITLTEKGVLLRRRAEEMLQLADKTCCELSCEECISGNVYIGVAVHSAGALALIGKAFLKLRESYPEVGLRLESGSSCALYDRLIRGNLDFVLLPSDYTCSTLKPLRLPASADAAVIGIYVGQDSPLAAKAALSPEDLAGVPLALPSDQDERELLGVQFAKADVVPAGACEYDLLEDALSCLHADEFAVLGREAQGRYDGWRFIPFAPLLTAHAVLCSHQGGTPSPAASKFYECMSALAGSDESSGTD